MGKKIAVMIVAKLVQEEEAIYPLYRLREAGYKVEVATPNADDVLGKYGMPIKATMGFVALNQLEIADIAVVILPGGWSPGIVRQDQRALDFVKAADDNDIIIGAICHGPQICFSAGVIRGRRCTCYKGIRDDLVNAGGIYQDAAVVVHDNLITSPHYNDCPAFMREILKLLDQRENAR